MAPPQRVLATLVPLLVTASSFGALARPAGAAAAIAWGAPARQEPDSPREPTKDDAPARSGGSAKKPK